METRELSVHMELVDDFEFRVRFDEEMEELLMDEPPPVGSNRGPSATRVLSAAVGNCLSTSLLFCLRKTRMSPEGVRTTVTTELTRNERGRLRIGSTRVEIEVGFDPEDRERIERCMNLFEDYCVVTQSVRRGIEVEVSVLDREGEEIYRSEEEEEPTAGSVG